MKKFVAIVASCTTALFPIMATSAAAFTVGTATVTDPVAAGPNATTLAAQTAVCNALAISLDLDGPDPKSDIYQASVTQTGSTLVAGPTETGTRVKSNIVGIGTFTPGVTYIQGNPFRIGGSVNMFGDQYATSGSWSDSTYDFTNSFASTWAYAYSCAVESSEYHPPVHHDAVPVQGFYINCDFGHGQGNDNNGETECTVANAGAPQGSCEAHNNTGPTFGQWGYDTEQCKWIQTAPAQPAYDDPEYWDAFVPVGTFPQTAINQDQTDTLSGHENHGGPVQAAGGPFHIGQVVICISPSTGGQKGVPGVWRQQNGYTGNKCNTDWFQSKGIYLGAGAVWGAGTESSNGTYISVPNYTY